MVITIRKAKEAKAVMVDNERREKEPNDVGKERCGAKLPKEKRMFWVGKKYNSTQK